MVGGKTFGATLWRYRNFLIIVLTAVLLLPLPLLIPGQESQCGYLMLLMGVYWCTEALPLSITGMIPIFTMPMLGLIPSEEVAVLYMQESTLMFFGGLMVALAFEKCNLHKRIALAVLVVMGTKPIWLMLGFMLPTWFLSMWISNTATTSMMIPIMEAVLAKLNQSMNTKTRSQSRVVEGHDNLALDDLTVTAGDGDLVESNLNDEVQEKKRYVSTIDTYEVKEANGSSFDLAPPSLDGDDSDNERTKTPEDDNSDPKFLNLCKGMTLAVAYSANIGGTGTLTGTTPNVIMKDFADDLWQENLCTESPVNFASWMVYGVPTATITLCIMWLWLAIYYLGPQAFKLCFKKSESEENDVNEDIRRELNELGRMKYAEWFTLFIFVAMVMLWVFRSPGFITGWGDVLNPGFIKDSVPSIMCTVALFVLPMFPPRWGSEKKHGKVESLLDWQIIHERFPWGIIFLVGGGFCLAEAALRSGLSDVIADALTVFEVLPVWFMTTVLAFFTALLTEITSNTATCTIIMPIVSAMANKLGLNPLYLMFPCSVATSYAFMLPVATPPNAIAFSYGRISVLDMVKAGAVLKLCVFVLTLGTETWGMAYFNFDVPPWDNNTLPCGVPTAAYV